MDQPLPFEDSRSHFETRPVRVVCLHAPQDASYGAALERHLAPLANEGLVEIFHPGLLQGGENTEERLKAELSRAQIVLLLLTADFLASATSQEQIDRILQERADRALAVVPVLVRAMDWKHGPLGALRALPRNEVPVTTWKRQDAAWLDVVTGLRSLVVGGSTDAAATLAPPSNLGGAPTTGRRWGWRKLAYVLAILAASICITLIAVVAIIAMALSNATIHTGIRTSLTGEQTRYLSLERSPIYGAAMMSEETIFQQCLSARAQSDADVDRCMELANQWVAELRACLRSSGDIQKCFHPPAARPGDPGLRQLSLMDARQKKNESLRIAEENRRLSEILNMKNNHPNGELDQAEFEELGKLLWALSSTDALRKDMNDRCSQSETAGYWYTLLPTPECLATLKKIDFDIGGWKPYKGESAKHVHEPTTEKREGVSRKSQ